jgi:hypothetical protein
LKIDKLVFGLESKDHDTENQEAANRPPFPQRGSIQQRVKSPVTLEYLEKEKYGYETEALEKK